MADSNHEVLIQRKSVPTTIPSDDGSVISKVVSSCGSRSVSLFDVNQLLAILKNILPGAQPNPQPVNVDTAMLEAIRKISKLAYSFSTSNKEEILEQILRDDYLSKYGWDVTMVTVLASFATNYAAFRVQSFMQASAVKLVVEIDKGMVATVEMIEQALKLMNLREQYKVQVSTSSSSVDYVTQAVCNMFHIVVTGSSLVTGTETNSEALTSFTTTTAQIKTTVQALSAEIKTTTEKGQIQKVVSKKVSIYEAISEVVSIRGTRSVGLFDVNKLLPIVRNTLPSAYAKPEYVNVDTAMVEAIRKLSSKLPSESSTTSNIEEILQEIHSNAYLSEYGWDVMMVTVLASFGTKYAAFRMQSFMQASAKKIVVEIDKGMVATVEMIENALKLMNLRKENKVQVSTSSSSVDYVTQAVCNTIHIVVMGSSLVTGIVANNEALKSFTTITSKIKTVVRALSVEVEAITEKVDWQTIQDVFRSENTPSIAASLNALIKPDPRGLSALVTCNNQEKVIIEQIKGDNVYLVITGDDSSTVEMLYLAELMKMQTKYQLVFIPMSASGEGLYGSQPPVEWYTVRTRSLVRKAAIKFIREYYWRFEGKTIVVRLGIKYPCSFDIDWICARRCFPTDNNSPPLPKLSFDYLLRDIYRLQPARTRGLPIQCLYGGDSVGIESFIQQWAKFTTTCSLKYQVNLEFTYVSRRIDADNDHIFNQINKANFGTFWKAKSMECWCFWSRVHSYFMEQVRLKGPLSDDVLNEPTSLELKGGDNLTHVPWIVFGVYLYGVSPIITHIKTATVAMEKLIATERLNNATFFEALRKKIAAEPPRY